MVEPDKKRTFFIHFFFMIDGWRPHDLAKFPLCRRTKVHIKLARLSIAQKFTKLQILFKETSSLKVSFPHNIGCEKINPNKTNRRALFWYLEWFLCTDTMMEAKIWTWLIFSKWLLIQKLATKTMKLESFFRL